MIRTIIVDDEILSRIGMQSFLDGNDGIIVEAVFGMASDAVAFLQENPVDVVITDIEMEEMDGLDFIRVIREQNLADGVIIVSCHDDFSYAQEAISRGTDSYILKHHVTQEKLIEEVKKVYEKVRHASIRQSVKEHKMAQKKEQSGEGTYCVTVIRVQGHDMKPEQVRTLDGSMLVHLLEGIVDRYEMGTFFPPVSHEMFILFRFEQALSEEKVRKQLYQNLEILENNIKQYMNESFSYGISGLFLQLSEVRERYQHAVSAIDQSYYNGKKTFYLWKKKEEDWHPKEPELKGLLEPDFSIRFENELKDMLDQASFLRVPVPEFKENLILRMNRLVNHIFQEYPVSEESRKKMNPEVLFISAVTDSGSGEEVRMRLMEAVSRMQTMIREEIDQDEMTEILNYLNRNLDQKLSLNDLADRCCMSVSSFCKKFKDRTGFTVTQYMNEQRIAKVIVLLKNRRYSLEEIAEMTGFHNANYMVRVFKKTTGSTISECRNVNHPIKK